MARKVYSQQFKDEACKLVIEQGYSAAKACQELGIAAHTLDYWLKKRGRRVSIEHVPPDSDDPVVLKARIRELEKTLRRSEMEKEILKKRRLTSRARAHEVQVHSRATRGVLRAGDVRHARGFAQWLLRLA